VSESRQEEQSTPEQGRSDANVPRGRGSRSGEGIDSLINQLRQQHAERGPEPEESPSRDSQ